MGLTGTVYYTLVQLVPCGSEHTLSLSIDLASYLSELPAFVCVCVCMRACVRVCVIYPSSPPSCPWEPDSTSEHT